jgi:hypothetical protein
LLTQHFNNLLDLNSYNPWQIENVENNFESDSEEYQFDEPLHITLYLLICRSFKNLSRQPTVTSARITQGLFFGLILCCFYAPVGNNQNSIQNRIGNLYIITSLTFIGMLNCIAVFPVERNVFFREYIDGGYSLLSFFLTYFFLSVPFIIITSIIFSFMMTFLICLKPTFLAWMIFTYVVFCFIFVGECIGVIFCSLFAHVGLAVNIMSLVLSFFGEIVSLLLACSVYLFILFFS